MNARTHVCIVDQFAIFPLKCITIAVGRASGFDDVRDDSDYGDDESKGTSLMEAIHVKRK